MPTILWTRPLGAAAFVAAIAFVVASATAPSAASADGLELDVEMGVVYPSRNVVRIPEDDGTTFSLTDELETSAAPVSRLRIGYRLAPRHLVSALYAPLKLNAFGTVDRELRFAGAKYPAGSPLLAVYRFDSYRLTYRYSIVQREDMQVAVGVTGKIRDSEIALYGPRARVRSSRGFVPLANLRLEWRPRHSSFGVLVDADALVAPKGRAEDILVAGTLSLRRGLALYAGYRTLEGGADNDEVYTFAWLHYAVAGLRLEL